MSDNIGLRVYFVKRDCFEPQEHKWFIFPCWACKHNDKHDNEEPCSKCDHCVTSKESEGE